MHRSELRVVRSLVVVVVFCAGRAAHAVGPELSWVPVNASGGTLLEYGGADQVGERTDVILAAGSEYQVEFEIRLNGWGALDGPPTLGTYQTALDSRGLLGATAWNVANGTIPGVDLLPITGPHGGLDGCFQGIKLCHRFEPPMYFLPCAGAYCDVWAYSDPSCPGSDPDCVVCRGNPYFVFDGILNTISPTVTSIIKTKEKPATQASPLFRIALNRLK